MTKELIGCHFDSDDDLIAAVHSADLQFSIAWNRQTTLVINRQIWTVELHMHVMRDISSAIGHKLTNHPLYISELRCSDKMAVGNSPVLGVSA